MKKILFFIFLFGFCFLVFSQSGEENGFRAEIMNRIESHIDSGNYDAANQLLKKLPKNLDEFSRARYEFFDAKISNRKDDFENAEKQLQQLLKNYKTVLEKDKKLLGKTYFELAYSANGNYNQKNEIFYAEKALEVMRKSPQFFESSEIITAYNDLFYYQNNYGDLNGLEETERKFRKVFEKIQSADKAFPYARRVYRKMQIIVLLINKKPNEAVEILNVFKKETASRNENNINYINSCYSEIDSFYYNEQDFFKCINASQISADYALKTNFPHYQMLAYSKIGASYLKLENYEKAIRYLDLSLSFIDNSSGFKSSLYSLNTMKAMAFSGLREYGKAGKLAEENISEIILKKIGKQTKIENLDFNDFKDLNSNYFINIFASSGHIFLEKYKKEHQKSDLEKAEKLFLIASEMFQEFYLKGEFNPLLHSLHTKISEGLLNIAFEKYRNNRKKTIEILELIENNSSKHLYKEFVRKRNISDKNSADFSGLSESKNRISAILKTLEKDRQIVKFYVGTNDIFQVLIRNNKVELLKPGQTNSVKKLATDFIGTLKNPSLVPRNSEALRKILLPKTETKKIILISDDFLNYLPFETLKNNGKFLAEDFDFSYHYSLSLWQINQSGNVKNKRKISVFAPVYKANSLFNGVSTPALPFAEKESENILKTFSGDLFSAENATKNNFYRQSKTSGILHLSMHSILDENDFRKSCLLFQDNVPLYFEELYKQNIPAEMVVLGACNTGNGYLKNGEGIMSISHAFTFAGSKSNVISLWEVPDKETAEIMHYFYKFLKKGQQKDEALSNAKQEFIKNNPLKNHPFFWAGFIVNGNTNPVSGNDYQWIFWLFSGIIAIGIFWFFRRKSV